MLRIIFLLPVFILALSPAISLSAEHLDQVGIHKLYEEGDFDKVIERIDAFRKSNSSSSHGDSVFIAKHLAVVYTANTQTVEVGKHWMYELLKVTPAADLAGMYVNEEIDRIFDKVKREFKDRQTELSPNTSASIKSTPTEKKPIPIQNQIIPGKTPENIKKWYWVGAGGAALVGLVATYVVLGSSSTKIDRQKVPVAL